MTRLFPKIGFLTLFLASFSPILAQDSADQADQEAETEQQAAEQDSAASPKNEPETAQPSADARPQRVSSADRRTLYFIGPDIRAQRQTGPLVGTPKKILPQPFVTPGSVPIPDPKPVELVGDEALAVDTQPLDQNTLEADVTASGLLPSLGEPVVSETADSAQTLDSEDIQAAELEQLDPSGIPVTTDRPGMNTIWEGYARSQIIKFLNIAAKPTRSMTMRHLARDIAASRFILPEPENDADIHAVIKARLAVFSAQADSQSFAALIDALPQDRDWSAIAPEIVMSHILEGRLVDACAAGELERAIDSDPFWVKLSAFCLAANGNRSGVDFELRILEEGVNLDAAFYQLIDRILVEGEQPPGAIIADPAPLNATLKADVLSAVMARLARVQVDAIDLTNAEMLALPLLLANPGLSDEVRMQLVRYGLANGYALKADWVQFASTLELSEGMLTLLYSSQEEVEPGIGSSDEQSVETSGTATQGLEAFVDPNVDPNAESIAVMAALMQGIPRVREAALAKVMGEGALGALSYVAPFITEIGEQWVPADVSPEAQAMLARLAVLAGDEVASNHWMLGLRSAVAGGSREIDSALVSLVPYLALQEGGVYASAIPDWLNRTSIAVEHSGQPDASANALEGDNAIPLATVRLPEGTLSDASLLFAVMEALAEPLDEDMWALLVGAPYSTEGRVIAPQFWRMLQDASSRQDPVDTLSHLMVLMQDMKPADMPAAGTAAILKAMQDVGFGPMSRQLAAEILVEKGL